MPHGSSNFRNVLVYVDVMPDEDVLFTRDHDSSDRTKTIHYMVEALPGQIPGMISCVIRTELGSKSNADCMMECTFESMEALEAYRTDPRHMEIAVTKVRPYTIDRLGVDYEVS